LNEFGIGLFLLDLTRPEIGVAAVRAISPKLQPFDTSVTTQRLARARRESGGTATTAVPLF
jgi:ribosomal protein S12 methylthiotransferase accessory factor YcaO